MSPNTIYKTIILFSIAILSVLLAYLSYNTFVLHDQQHQNVEKLLIKRHYTEAIRNDKLFPGGQAVMDSHLLPNLPLLDSLQMQDTLRFEEVRDSLLNRLVADLKGSKQMDSLFTSIRQSYQLDTNWNYALVLKRIVVTLVDEEKITLLDPTQYDTDSQIGVRLTGQLKTLRPQNMVTEITVSTPTNYSYEVSFGLYADRSDRKLITLKLVAPFYLLGLVFIVIIVVIYFLTYKSWAKQKRLSDMKSDFVNSITHEFHTPISTILVATKTLTNKLKEPTATTLHSDTLPLTKVIERQALRLQHLFSQVLHITAIESRELHKEEIELSHFLQEIIQDYRLKTANKNVDITYNPSTPYSVLLNPFLVTTMVINLLDNAIKHNTKPMKKVRIELVEVGRDLQLIISDNGEGIAEQEISHIFDKFYRHSGASTNGLGLGLYYVQQCIHSHQWKINVTTTVSAGSQFIITIPKI